MDVPSPAAGRVGDLKVKVGDRVSKGAAILSLATDGAAAAPDARAEDDKTVRQPKPRSSGDTTVEQPKVARAPDDRIVEQPKPARPQDDRTVRQPKAARGA